MPGGGTFTVGDVVAGAIETPARPTPGRSPPPGQSVVLDVTALSDLGGRGCRLHVVPRTPMAHRGTVRLVFGPFRVWCGWNSGVLVLPAGAYALTVDAYADEVVGYQFKVWNVPPPTTGRSPSAVRRSAEPSNRLA